MQMLQVWLQLSEGTGWSQISSLTEGDPGHMHIWSHSVWNLLEPILWHPCKWFTQVSMENDLSGISKFLSFITLSDTINTSMNSFFFSWLHLTVLVVVSSTTLPEFIQLYLIAGKLENAKQVQSFGVALYHSLCWTFRLHIEHITYTSLVSVFCTSLGFESSICFRVSFRKWLSRRSKPPRSWHVLYHDQFS